MYMIFFVLDDTCLLDKLLEKWTEAGIKGVTIMESTGIHRVLKTITPMRYEVGYGRIIEEGHYTLVSIVPKKEMVNRCLKATEAVVGDLSQPNTGIFTSWPVTESKGVTKKR